MYPRIYTNLFSKYVKHVKELGMSLEYMHAEFYPHWGLDGPKYYMISRVLHSPDVDVNALLNQFCTDMFGRGKKEMKLYFETLEKLSYSMNNTAKVYRKMFEYPKQMYLNEQELELVKQARKHLDKAAKLAKKSDEDKRIELFSKTFRLSEYIFEMSNAKEIDEEKIKVIKKYVAEKIATDSMTLYYVRKKDVIVHIDNVIKGIVNSKKK